MRKGWIRTYCDDGTRVDVVGQFVEEKKRHQAGSRKKQADPWIAHDADVFARSAYRGDSGALCDSSLSKPSALCGLFRSGRDPRWERLLPDCIEFPLCSRDSCVALA